VKASRTLLISLVRDETVEYGWAFGFRPSSFHCAVCSAYHIERRDGYYDESQLAYSRVKEDCNGKEAIQA
jgi:hypothetical protein